MHNAAWGPFRRDEMAEMGNAYNDGIGNPAGYKE